MMENVLFVGTVRKQYAAGMRAASDPARLVWRIILFLLGGTLTTVVILAALYSDFVLGMAAGNMTGWPSSDNAVFYWIYIAAKRLPLFSM